MKTRGKKTVQVVSTADIASAPSTSQSQLVTYPNSGPLIGHGNQVVLSRTVSPSKLDETNDKNWKKFAAEFRLHIMELYPAEDIYKATFNEEKNRNIYKLLLQATGTKCLNMVHRVYEDKGKEAFLSGLPFSCQKSPTKKCKLDNFNFSPIFPNFKLF